MHTYSILIVRKHKNENVLLKQQAKNRVVQVTTLHLPVVSICTEVATYTT